MFTIETALIKEKIARVVTIYRARSFDKKSI